MSRALGIALLAALPGVASALELTCQMWADPPGQHRTVPPELRKRGPRQFLIKRIVNAAVERAMDDGATPSGAALGEVDRKKFHYCMGKMRNALRQSVEKACAEEQALDPVVEQTLEDSLRVCSVMARR